METWQAGFIDVSGGRIHATWGGHGAPPVLLVHGATEDGQCFPHVAEALCARHTVVMPDARSRAIIPTPGRLGLRHAGG